MAPLKMLPQFKREASSKTNQIGQLSVFIKLRICCRVSPFRIL